jgi:hypothetical protein
MSGYYNSYYDTLSTSLSSMSGGASFDNENLIIYVLLGIIVIVIMYSMREVNKKYENIIDNINRPIETKIIQVPQQIQQQNQQENRQQNQQENIQKRQESEPQNIQVNLHKGTPSQPQKTPFELWREYDYRSLNDPLVAPRRRDDFNLPVLPLPTRGYPAAYKKVGMLVDRKAHDNDRYKFLLLMGRNTHPGSYVFEYYAMENDKNGSLKFDVCRRGRQELQSDDKVRINELDRTYTVVMDKMLGYEYDPYLY